MNSMPTTAIYYLSAILKQQGIMTKIVDPWDIRKCLYEGLGLRQLRKELNKWIEGIEVIAVSSNTLNWSMTKMLLSIISELDVGIPIILGGLHPSYYPKHVLESTCANYAIVGEGELILPKLIERILYGDTNSIDSMNGVAYKKNNQVVINPKEPFLDRDCLQMFPLPDFSELPQNAYLTQPIASSKGCLFSCAFCSIPSRKRWIGFDSQWVVERVGAAIQNYQGKFLTRSVYITDDCFTADKKRAISILQGLNESNDLNQAQYVIEARVNDLRFSSLSEMIGRCSSVTRVACGVESGYDEGLKNVGKQLTVAQISEALAIVQKNNFINRLAFSFIIGFPWEDRNDCIKTINYAAELVKEYGIAVNLNWLSLYPSRIWDEREKYGIKLTESFFDDSTLGTQSGASTAHHELSMVNDMDNKFSMFSPLSFLYIRPRLSVRDVNHINGIIENYENNGVLLRSP